jgi:AraC-like DNA-binding protein
MPALQSDKPLDPRLVTLLCDVQWLAYRLWGILSHLRSPNLGPEEDAFGFQLPAFCAFVHAQSIEEVPGVFSLSPGFDSPTHHTCQRLKTDLVRKAQRTPAFGCCAAGFRMLCHPLRWRNRVLGHVLFGPWRNGPVPSETIERFAPPGSSSGFRFVDELSWGAQEVPKLDRREERALLGWSRQTLNRLLAQYGALVDGASWEEVVGTHWEPLGTPVRLGADAPVVLSIATSWPYDGKPSFAPAQIRLRYWDLVYAERDTARLILNGSGLELPSGRIVLIPPGAEVSTDGDQDANCRGVQFQFVGQLGMFLDLVGRPIAIEAHQRELLRWAYARLSQDPPLFNTSLARLHLLDFLLSLKHPSPPSGHDEPIASAAELERRPALAASAKRYLEEHAGEPVSVTELARACGANKFTIAHVFKQQTGISLIQYHSRIRMEAAQASLRTGKHSVTEIAHQLGFNDTAHFSHAFKRAVGVSPSEYARRVRVTT